MIIDPKSIIDLTRKLIMALQENTVALDRFTDTLKSLEVRQDALDLELRSHEAPPPEVKS